MEQVRTRRVMSFYCQVIIILLGLITLRLWMMPAEVLPYAQGQIPDEGLQRLKLIQETEETNKLLTSIDESLKGTIKVKIEDGDHDVKKKEAKRKKSH